MRYIGKIDTYIINIYNNFQGITKIEQALFPTPFICMYRVMKKKSQISLGWIPVA